MTTQCWLVTLKTLELTLALAIVILLLYAEIETAQVDYLLCFEVLGVCAMAFFLSLVYLCATWEKCPYGRVTNLLAATIGAFSFLTLAIYLCMTAFSDNASKLFAIFICLACLLNAIVHFIDMTVIYCYGAPEPNEVTQTKTKSP